MKKAPDTKREICGASASSGRCKIGYITVNYNSSKATALLLSDLSKQVPGPFHLTIVVADNSPSELELESVRQFYRDCPQVHFERMPTNLGYFGAAHWVFQTIWKDSPPEWVVVSNPDIRLPQQDLLLQISKLSAKFGVVAPRILSSRTHRDQNPFFTKRPSVFRLNLLRLIFRIPILYWLLELRASVKNTIRGWLLTRGARTAADPVKIYAPHGAFILFSREYFRRGGSLLFGAFLFTEEIFVAETCRRLGLDVTYLPRLEVLHEEHIATGKSGGVRRFKAAAADYLVKEFFANASQ